MNPMQRHAAAVAAAQPIPSGRDGYWVVSGSAMEFSGHVWRRGSVVPISFVEQIEHNRLAVMVQNRLLAHRLGVPPATAPAAVPMPPSADPAVEREAMLRNMRASGYSAYELDASARPEPGMFARPAHPSEMVKPSRFSVSQSGGIIDG